MVILCDTHEVSRDEERKITARIRDLLPEKGAVISWNRKTQHVDINVTQSGPGGKSAAATSDRELLANTSTTTKSERDSELVLHTLLRHGEISYDKDEKYRAKIGEWRIPEAMTKKLYTDYKTTAIAQLMVYRSCKNGEYSFVVTREDKSGAWSLTKRVLSSAWDLLVNQNTA